MKFRAITAAAAVLAAFSAGASAQEQQQQSDAGASANLATSPDVNLTPRRVIFGPNDRGVKEVTVFNRTNATATYTITLVDEVMTPDGALVATDKAPAGEAAQLKSAAGMLRYSPRQMVLGPKEAQTVRIQARPPGGGPPAEYRTHFSVIATPPQSAGTDIEAAASGEQAKNLAIKLTPVYGIMIPIIVRTGDLDAQAQIANVQYLKGNGRNGIGFDINRSGQRSTYGQVEVFLLGGSKPQKIAGIKGLGVYPETNKRHVTLPFDEGAKVGPGSRVKIVYTDDEANVGKVLAETEATLS